MGKVDQQPATDFAAAVLATYQGREDWCRDHLGASIIGHQCARYVWLSFRWAMEPGHDGRMLRLFERGRREEAWLIDDMMRAGIKVDVSGDGDDMEQEHADLPGHLGGSVDGILPGGIPGDARPMLLEVKTHSTKSFEWLQRKRVRAAKPQHWAQMQTYMHGRPEKVALYVAVCKETDELHAEIVEYDEAKASALVARGVSLSMQDAAPDRMDADQPPCVLTSRDGKRWPCQYYELCHGQETPARSCRTCISSTARADGAWHCEAFGESLDPIDQRVGCVNWCPNHTMVTAQVVWAGEHRIKFRFADGAEVELGKSKD